MLTKFFSTLKSRPIKTNLQSRGRVNLTKPSISDEEVQKYIDNYQETGLEIAISKKAIFMELLQSKWSFLFLFTKKTSLLRANALIIYERIIAQGDRPEFKGSSLPQDFGAWVRLAFLHMWLVDVRFRYIEKEAVRDCMTQPITDWLWSDIELGLSDTLDTSNSILITKHSKRYVQEWFGTALAMDYGMMAGDCQLAESLWRNLYAGSLDVSLAELSKMVTYVRQQQHKLSELSDADFLEGNFEFITPPFQIPEEEAKRLAEEEKLKNEIIARIAEKSKESNRE